MNDIVSSDFLVYFVVSARSEELLDDVQVCVLGGDRKH
jgi:hypothetical protein